ncbi:MAG TPA: hypothetical protein VJA21_31190, partial [Verrucomicrobiae bacterium]
MNTALLQCVGSTAWAFTAVLASTSALGAEAVAPWLTLEQQHSYPRLAWANVLGHTYSIQTRERVSGGDWASVVTLTTDAKTRAWTDVNRTGSTWVAAPCRSWGWFTAAQAALGCWSRARRPSGFGVQCE